MSTGSRFERLHRIGGGASGVVYDAVDHARDNARVALKVLHRVDAEAVYQLKREFRALADVAHPNLVVFHELLTEGDDWLLVMERIDGQDVLSWIRDAPDPGARAARTLRAIEQLTDGLSALHAAGVVHRDIKPSNVLVAEGRLVIVDFGLARPARDRSTDDDIVGTAAYIAPEHVRGEPVGPAADWYAVGVILHQALTGATPFEGSVMDVLAAKEWHEPPPVNAPMSPALAALCDHLLARDPAARAGAAHIGAALGSDAPNTAGEAEVELVGRHHQLDALEQALRRVERGTCVTVQLRGQTGMGKTALAQAFTDRAAAAGRALVLEGRCYERESVPYKAFDSLIDDLADTLEELPPAEVDALVPSGAGALVRLFPVLRRVDALARAPAPDAAVDPFELRHSAGASLRELLSRLARARPVILWIDDLQWGDNDSAALLAELTRPPDPPPVLICATVRTDTDDEDLLDRTVRQRLERSAAGQVLRIPVGPLDPTSARELALALLGDHPGADDAANAISWEAAGNPLFIRELVAFVRSGRILERGGDAPSVTLEEVLHHRFERLPHRARELLDVIAVGGGPLRLRDAARAARLPDDGAGEAAILRAATLVRGRAALPDDFIEILHDRVRDAALAALSPERTSELHLRIALALQSDPRADAEVLAHHWRDAGEPEPAQRYTLRAAQKAADALAFDRAAALFGEYLEYAALLPAERFDAQVARAEALASAGLGADAGQMFLAAMDNAPDQTTAADLEGRAAKQLLRAGRVDDGLAVLRRALAAHSQKLPHTPRTALASLLYHRARLRLSGLDFHPRDAREVPAHQLAAVDALWGATSGLAMIDPIRGAELQTRALRLALATGERSRVCRALVAETAIVGTGGTRTAKRTDALVARNEALAAEVGTAYARATARTGRAYACFLRGEWRDTVEAALPAIGLFRNRCTGAWWEMISARHLMLWSMAYLGQLGELARRVPPALREAEARGDLYASTMLSTGLLNWAWLGKDDYDVARERLAYAEDRWSIERYHLQHYNHMLARTQLDLYVGAAAAAARRVEDGWAGLAASMLLRTQQIRLEAVALRARASLAAGLAGDGGALRGARTHARALMREKVGWSTPLGGLVMAALAVTDGNDDGARKILLELPAAFEAAEMPLHGHVARDRLGRLEGGDAGTERAAAAEEAMLAAGVGDPAAWAQMIAPWPS